MHRYTFLLVGLAAVVLAGFAPQWGGNAHRLINRAATTHLPAEFQFFAQWAGDLEALSTAADERKCCDPDERPRHFIDIDDYPEFFNGDLPESYSGMVDRYGESRVIRNGVAPWAIDAAYREMVDQLSAREWEGAVAAAADIGHYLADLHNPLHLTLNYDGQLSGQRGVHARYESEMTSRHLNELVPASSQVIPITDPLGTVFDWIDVQYQGLAPLLSADSLATAEAGGSTSSTAYYDALWREMGGHTQDWVRDASIRIASLWYAAWVQAGSPQFTNTATEDQPTRAFGAVRSFPNPTAGGTSLRFDASGGYTEVLVFDILGRQVRNWPLGVVSAGPHEIRWDGLGRNGRRLPDGVYQVVIQGASSVGRAQVVLVR